MDEQNVASKISELKKLKGLFRDIVNLFNDPIEKKDPKLAKKAFDEACERVHQRLYERNSQIIGRPADKRLHNNAYSDDNIRQSLDDCIRRKAEIIYRSKDAEYAKAVDSKNVEFDNLLAEIEDSYYFLCDIFQRYHWTKGTILSADFGYFRMHARSINKRWFVGEITEAIDTLGKIQNALEREFCSVLKGRVHDVDTICLTNEQVEILGYVDDMHPTIAYQTDYANKNKIDPKTVRKNVKALFDCGLLRRPEGKKRGMVITRQGLKHIQDHYS